jgi:hypothetical protein
MHLLLLSLFLQKSQISLCYGLFKTTLVPPDTAAYTCSHHARYTSVKCSRTYLAAVIPDSLYARHDVQSLPTKSKVYLRKECTTPNLRTVAEMSPSRPPAIHGVLTPIQTPTNALRPRTRCGTDPVPPHPTSRHLGASQAVSQLHTFPRPDPLRTKFNMTTQTQDSPPLQLAQILSDLVSLRVCVRFPPHSILHLSSFTNNTFRTQPLLSLSYPRAQNLPRIHGMSRKMKTRISRAQRIC